jgi:hypothetical protein
MLSFVLKILCIACQLFCLNCKETQFREATIRYLDGRSNWNSQSGVHELIADDSHMEVKRQKRQTVNTQANFTKAVRVVFIKQCHLILE